MLTPWTLAAALAVSACTGSAESAAPEIDPSPMVIDDGSLETIAPVSPDASPSPGASAVDDEPRAKRSSGERPGIALIDVDGRLGIVDGSTVRNDWMKFDAFPSPDRTTAVMTLGQHISGIGPERPVMWASLPGGEPIGEQTMRTDSELTATSLDGALAGFTTRAGEPIAGAIAGTRRSSLIEIISRDDGLLFSQELAGNFVPEAFSRTTTAGVPDQVFLLEYFPADVPRFYRVRVLSTATGEVSLPLNLRDKQQQVDERMAGFSRSQVVAHEQGLLFTLYRGTIDGTPDGEPYAFVHTLDFADGVWCLEVDPSLDLGERPGSLAVGGDRLYVASSNGRVGSFEIPSISDPTRSPTMDWVVDAFASTDDEPPVITADDDAVYVSDPDRPGFLARVDPAGDERPPTRMFGDDPTAFAWSDGALHAIGDHWATFGHVERPEWLGEIEYLVIGGE